MSPQEDKWTPKGYSTNASFVYSAKFASPVLDLLGAQPGVKACSPTTPWMRQLLPGGRVSGLDSSPSLLRAAIQLALNRLNPTERERIDWFELDGHELVKYDEVVSTGSFDAVFSNAALHWMKRDPERVIRGVHRVLKPGGRFVAEMGGFLNMVGVRSALHTVLSARGYDPVEIDPWFFPTPQHYRRLLEQNGFRVETCDLVPRPTALPTGLRGWLETFAFEFLAPLGSTEEKDQVIAEVEKMCQVDLKDPASGEWMVMYVRLRFKAWKI
ncbi:class I SAM-dependent methyltransferase [Sporobolomyces koalae]|uniref:class I SAM-dependent methyltransferase n=1 Tax=Sporobolomyces koalae TaxID=500713 RepID=UPI0031801BC0